MSHLFTVKLKIVLTNGLACSIIYRNVNSSIAQATHIVCFHSLEIRLIVVIVILNLVNLVVKYVIYMMMMVSKKKKVFFIAMVVLSVEEGVENILRTVINVVVVYQ